MHQLLSRLDGGEAATVELQQVSGIFVGLGGGDALESDTGAAGLAVTSGHGNELHHVKRNIFNSTGTEGNAGTFVHLIFSLYEYSHLNARRGIDTRDKRR